MHKVSERHARFQNSEFRIHHLGEEGGERGERKEVVCCTLYTFAESESESESFAVTTTIATLGLPYCLQC